MELVEALAPFVVNSHIKDMAVEEYADGFFLSEVPLGQGMLALKRMTATLLKAQPENQVLARHADAQSADDSLPHREVLGDVPATQRSLPGADAAHGARQQAGASRWFAWTSMDQEARVRLEQDNVRQSVDYARDQLGLRV